MLFNTVSNVNMDTVTWSRWAKESIHKCPKILLVLIDNVIKRPNVSTRLSCPVIQSKTNRSKLIDLELIDPKTVMK